MLPRTNRGTRPTVAKLLTALTVAAAVIAFNPATAAATSSAPPAPGGTASQPANPVTVKAASPASIGAHPTKRACPQPSKAGQMACLSVIRTDVAGVRPGVTPGGFGPADLAGAYHLPGATAGGGTVGIVDAFDYPNAEAELAIYRAQYGLPSCSTANGCFRRVDQRGGTQFPPPDTGWQQEMALDMDMVSAICPNCHITLVEADDNTLSNLGAGVDEAVALGAKFVSNSYGGPEDPSESQSDTSFYNHPGVAVTASSGDNGFGVSYPAASPFVTSVGGTSLFKDTSARGWSESAWSGAGSGCSAFEPKPAFQTDTGCAQRTVADVAAVADPNTGVAVYVQGGWQVFGGTSVASPIIASVYALGGDPVAGTAPVAYPYANPGAFNDVTSGSNGTCTPGYLCTAGPGYDGPTGLGTPNGLAGFSSGPSGTVSGAVTDATGAAVAGARVATGDRSTSTDARGHYALTVPVGTYTVTATKFGFTTGTATAVAVTNGQTVTRNFTLTALPRVTVSGVVRDGSGHGWPVYAQVQVAGQPTTATFTDPATGHYQLSVPTGATYTVQVDPIYVGYLPDAHPVTVAQAAVTHNVSIKVDPATCSALGYANKFVGTTQTFDTTTAPTGWTVDDQMGNGQTWGFTDPAARGNLTGGTGGFAMIDSDHYGQGNKQDSALFTPVTDFTGVANPTVQFANDYHGFAGQTGDVDFTVDGGKTWTNVWHHSTDNVRGPDTETVALPGAAGQKAVQIRFRFTGFWSFWWELDNVFIGDRTCSPLPGGLVTGHVNDHNTGKGINGAAVHSTDAPTDTAITRAMADPAQGDGFFWLFSSLTGAHPFTAASGNYVTATQSVTVAANKTTPVTFSLTAGRLKLSPVSISKTVNWQGQASQVVSVTNTGSAPADFKVFSQPGGFTMQTPGAPLVSIKGDYPAGPLVGPTGKTAKRLAAQAVPATPSAAPWQAVADYPTTVMDNGVVAVSGKVYSFTGFDGTSLLAKNYVYDPSAQTWTGVADIPTPREKPAVATVNGKVYVIGGWGTDGNPVATTAIYDPAGNTWSTGAPNPAPYAASGITVVAGKIYVAGGCLSQTCGATTVSVYDPVADSWSAGPALPQANAWLGCGAIAGTVYCAGGNTDAGAVKAGYSLVPGATGWGSIADLPQTQWAAGTVAANGRLMLSGGVLDGALSNAGYAYDPGTNTWAALPNANNTLYRGGSACGFYKIGGSSGNFNATSIDELLPGFDQCGDSVSIPWLSVSPAGGTVAPGKTVQFTVSLDASVAAVNQPGAYTAGLAIAAPTPYPVPAIPVTLTVKPPPTWGKITGTIAGAVCHGSTVPIPGATLQIDTWAQHFTLKTDANGQYQLWLDVRNNPLTLIAAKDNWQPQTRQVNLVRLKTVTAGFTLLPDTC
ncbi:MAG TPA: carboxypeptidase regulatory-like domain-containing protein [Pseudonocardiaceae bacterium]